MSELYEFTFTVEVESDDEAFDLFNKTSDFVCSCEDNPDSHCRLQVGTSSPVFEKGAVKVFMRLTPDEVDELFKLLQTDPEKYKNSLAWLKDSYDDYLEYLEDE